MVDDHERVDVRLERFRVVAQADDCLVGVYVRIVASERKRETVTELRAPLVVDMQAFPVLFPARHRLSVAAGKRVRNRVIVALRRLTDRVSKVDIRVLDVAERENQFVEVLYSFDFRCGERFDERVGLGRVTHVDRRVECDAVAVGKAHQYARSVLCVLVLAVGRAALLAREDVSRVVDAEGHFVDVRLAADRRGVYDRVNAADIKRDFFFRGSRAVGLDYHRSRRDGRAVYGQRALGNGEFCPERFYVLDLRVRPHGSGVCELGIVSTDRISRGSARGDGGGKHRARYDSFPFSIHSFPSCLRISPILFFDLTFVSSNP